MTPYLAVIHDSFREATSSRVLWILLLFTTLLLALIAPIGVDQQLAWELRAYDLLDAQALAAALYEARESDDETPQARLWRLLNDSARQRVGDLALSTRVGGRELFGKSRQLADDLNVALARRDFYHELAYQQVALRPETQRWLRQEEADLSETELARRNRLLLEDAFPGTILAVPRQSVALKWGPWSYPRARPIGEDQLKMFVEATVAAFMNFFVGIVGVFVAVLVTAPMVPRMFDSGSLYLLLSKPVSRTLIYLSKFVGACIFILINASYLIVGLYLVVGLRFDVWNPRLLLAIPIFLFLFAVYFSVTALASLVWKNAIVSIAVTILFWLGCLTVDWVKTGVEALFINPPRTERIVAAGDQLFRQDQTSAVYRWDETLDDWQEVFLKEGEQPGGNWLRRNRPQRIGPVYDDRREQLLAVESDWSPFNALGVKGELWVAAPRRGWNRVAWSESPGAVYALHERPDAGPLAVGSQGVSAVNTDIKPDGQATELLGFKLPFGRRETSFVPYSVTPPLVIQPPLASAYDAANGRMFLWVNQSLLRLESDSGERLEVVQQEPYAERAAALLLAAGGHWLLAARADGELHLFDADTLRRRAVFDPQPGIAPRSVAASSSGEWFAVLYQNDRLVVVTTQNKQARPAEVAGQGGITAIQAGDDNSLWVADRISRLRQYALPTGQVLKEAQGPTSTLELLYRYAITPIYTVFPRPTELGNTVTYLLTEQKSFRAERIPDDLSERVSLLDPWRPVWNSLAFMAIMLAIGCVYLERHEF